MLVQKKYKQLVNNLNVKLSVIVNPKPAINNSKLPVSCRYAELLLERELYGH